MLVLPGLPALPLDEVVVGEDVDGLGVAGSEGISFTKKSYSCSAAFISFPQARMQLILSDILDVGTIASISIFFLNIIVSGIKWKEREGLPPSPRDCQSLPQQVLHLHGMAG